MKATWLLPLTAATAFGALGFTAVVGATPGSGNIKHVLLLSIDGMHAIDFYNCAHGIEGANGGDPYCPNLAALGSHAVNSWHDFLKAIGFLSGSRGAGHRRLA